MKITDKIISIPPYISTTWDKVVTLHMRAQNLVVVLNDGTMISIPGLPAEIIEEIFQAHANFLEHLPARPPKETASAQPLQTENALGLPFRLFFGTLESLGQALQHNPAYGNLPPIPHEIANKLEILAKALPEDELQNLPNPEPGCHCIFCQMMNILKKGHLAHPQEIEETAEEEVHEEDLRFDQWEVEELGDKVFLVTNKLDPKEHYNVYLGDPIGCTCGKPNCEHIVAVLRH